MRPISLSARIVALLVAGAGAGCVEMKDADGDGYTFDVDCDDSDAAVHPGAPEVPVNGIDDNCDGTTDEDLPDFDDDGDGFTNDEGDCNDSNATVHPWATERCGNDVDEDCSGATDDLDLDGDGWTDQACGGRDCNDAEADIHPSATEVRGNLEDDDCNGVADEDVDAGAEVPIGADPEADVAMEESELDAWFDANEDCLSPENAHITYSPAPGGTHLPVTVVLVATREGAYRVPRSRVLSAIADANAWFADLGLTLDVVTWIDDHNSDHHAVLTIESFASMRAANERYADLSQSSVMLYVVPEGTGPLAMAAPLGSTTLPYHPAVAVTNLGLRSGSSTLVHELGHFFGLLHTQFGASGGWGTPELVDRDGNCTSAGDLLCDTPADPGPITRYPEEGCAYVVAEPCSIDYCGSDPAGDAYAGSTAEAAAMLGNVMSYYEDECNSGAFSPGQANRMLCFAQHWYDASDALVLGTDSDGDGYRTPSPDSVGTEWEQEIAPELIDCNDGDAAVHPGATEVCDDLDIDEDCDGQGDEPDDAAGTVLFVHDEDGDGFGNVSGTAVAFCAGNEPADYVPVALATDCNDEDVEIHPDADEVCDNGIDEDCDGQADESDAIDAGLFYADADGDSFGDPSMARRSCTDPSGYVGNSLDCNDRNKNISPAAEERCTTVGIDDDCDGLVDDDDLGVIDASTPWYTDLDGDGYGSDASAEYYCARTSPSGRVAAGGDCDDTDSAVNPSVSDPCDGIDNDCTGVIDDGTGSGLCPCDQGWFDGQAYLYCSSGKTWNSAESYCNSQGYKLVEFETSSEFTAVTATTSTLNGAGHWWIGLHDISTTSGTRTWRWSDGSTPTYPTGTGTTTSSSWPWAGSEPNSESEDCVELDGGRTHLWNDEDCGNSQGFVCEAAP